MFDDFVTQIQSDELFAREYEEWCAFCKENEEIIEEKDPSLIF